MGKAIKRIKEPQFEKTASVIKLSSDSDNWSYEILDYIYTKFGFLAKKTLEVEIKDKDEKSGYAIGAIWIDKKKKLYLPFVIKDFQLSPFDLLGTEKGLIPFNDHNFNLVNSKDELFKDIKKDKPIQRTGLESKLTAPGLTGTTGRDTITKKASLLTAIAPTVTSEEKARFITKLNNNPWLKEKLIKTKIAEKILVREYVPRQIKDKIEKVLSHAKVASIHNGVLSIISTDPFGHINTSKISAPDVIKVKGNKGVRVSKQIPYIKEAGVYEIIVDNEKTTGIVFPDLTDLDRKLSLSLVVNSKGYSLINKARGIKTASKIDLNADDPDGFGFFYLPEKNIATIPVFVKKALSSNKLLVKTASKEIKVVLGNVREIERVDNAYVFNKNFRFVKIPNRFIKLGSQYENPAKEVIVKYANNKYIISGLPIKVAYNLNELKHSEAELVLLALDATEKQAEVILKSAKKQNVCFYTDTKFKADKGLGDKSRKYTDGLKIDLTKEASMIMGSGLVKYADTTERTVDAILALDFLTPDNIETFASFLPQLEEAEKQLAELTFASRIGLETIPEKAASRAMSAVSEVVKNLRILQLYS